MMHKILRSIKLNLYKIKRSTKYEMSLVLYVLYIIDYK